MFIENRVVTHTLIGAQTRRVIPNALLVENPSITTTHLTHRRGRALLPSVFVDIVGRLPEAS